jgi:hypothetical protein
MKELNENEWLVRRGVYDWWARENKKNEILKCENEMTEGKR